MANRALLVSFLLREPTNGAAIGPVGSALHPRNLAVQAARAALTAAHTRFRAKTASTALFVSAFRTIVKGMFQKPRDAGRLRPAAARRHQAEPADQVDAVAKIKATRVARGTKGPKARAMITGTVAPATPPAGPEASKAGT